MPGVYDNEHEDGWLESHSEPIQPENAESEAETASESSKNNRFAPRFIKKKRAEADEITGLKKQEEYADQKLASGLSSAKERAFASDTEKLGKGFTGKLGKSGMRGNLKRYGTAISLIGVVGATLLGILGFFRTFTLEHLMANVNQETFIRFNASFDRRSDRWFRSYLQLRLGEIEGNTDPNQNNLFFRANRVDTNNPGTDWYRTMRASRFEKELFDKHGIKFTSIVEVDPNNPNGPPKIRSGLIQLVTIDGQGSGFSLSAEGIDVNKIRSNDLGELNKLGDRLDTHVRTKVFENDKVGRKEIKRIVRENTHALSFRKRRHVRKDISNMTGVRDWRFFDKTRTKVENKKAEFASKLIKKVLPADSKSLKLFECFLALSGSSCPAATDPNHADNRNAGGDFSDTKRDDDTRTVTETKDGETTTRTEVVDGTDTNRIVKEATEELTSEAAENLTDESIEGAGKKIAKKIVSDILGKGNLVISVLDKLRAINNLFKTDSNGQSKVDKLIRVARVTSAMTASAAFLTMADQAKSGEADPAQIGAAVEYLEGFENSEAYQTAIAKQPPNVVSAQGGGNCESTSEFKKGDYVPLCDFQKPNGGNRTSGFQDGWNSFISNGPIGVILDAYDALRDNPFTNFISGMSDKIIGTVIGPLLSATGAEDVVGKFVGFLSEKVSKWAGVLPCADGSEATGGLPMNCILIGASATAEAASRASGAVLSVAGTAQYDYNNKLAANYRTEEIKDKSTFERYFALSNNNSMASKLLFVSINQKPASFTRNFDLFSTLSNRTFAANELDIAEFTGNERYDIPQECQDLDPFDPNYLSKATNAPGDVPRTWEVMGDQAMFYDKVYEAVGGDEARAKGIYNCALFDKRVRGSLGAKYGYEGDDGYPESAGSSAPSGTGVSGTIVGDPYTDSSGVPCAAGTLELGLPYFDGYRNGQKFTVRLCQLPNMRSSGDADNPGSQFTTRGASGFAIVNSRVSGAWFKLIEDAKKAGISFSANSSFRSMPHQQALCAKNTKCANGDYSKVARPGNSSHQAGVAIDFADMDGDGGSTCASRARRLSDPKWLWLRDNAEKYGFKQYSAEAWHWDALPEANRCGATQ